MITNGREFMNLRQNGWVTELDPSMRPNFDANAAPWAKDPVYDPGNKYSMAWQSGLTGIGYNTEQVPGRGDKLDDLANPEIVGTNSVGMLKAGHARLGHDQPRHRPEDVQAGRMEGSRGLAADAEGLRHRPRRTAARSTSTTSWPGTSRPSMGWSGDVLYYKIWGDDGSSSFPGGGALLWIDNMMIPANAKNPQGALELMDFVYQPEVAQLITEWVPYMSPVPAVQDLIADHAKRRRTAPWPTACRRWRRARSCSPTRSCSRKTSFGRELSTDEESEEWDSIFCPCRELTQGRHIERERRARVARRRRSRSGTLSAGGRAPELTGRRQRARVRTRCSAPGGIYL